MLELYPSPWVRIALLRVPLVVLSMARVPDSPLQREAQPGEKMLQNWSQMGGGEGARSAAGSGTGRAVWG